MFAMTTTDRTAKVHTLRNAMERVADLDRRGLYATHRKQMLAALDSQPGRDPLPIIGAALAPIIGGTKNGYRARPLSA
jgi:hypothetical protein